MDIKVRDASLVEVLEVLQANGYQTFYNTRAAREVTGITLDLRGATVEEVLEAATRGTRLTYSVTGNTVVISERRAELQRSFRVSGRVEDESGTPLPGVTVLVKGTTVGVTTDTEGHFNFMVPEADSLD